MLELITLMFEYKGIVPQTGTFNIYSACYNTFADFWNEAPMYIFSVLSRS